jgi:hypothetical protein
MKLIYPLELTLWSYLDIFDLLRYYKDPKIIKPIISKFYYKNLNINQATKFGFNEKLNDLLRKGVIPDERTLNIAVSTGNFNAVQIITQAGIKPTVYTLNKACRVGDLKILKYLNEKCKIHLTGEFFYGLEIACKIGNLEIIKYIHSFNRRQHHKLIVDHLYYPIYNWNLDIIKYYIHNGINVKNIIRYMKDPHILYSLYSQQNKKILSLSQKCKILILKYL